MLPRPPAIALALLATALLAALILALTLGGSSGHPSSSSSSSTAFGANTSSGFDGAALPTGGPVHEFTLTDQAGRRVSLADYRGQITIVAFLYSTCGPTCVVIAQQIRGALDELPHPVPVLFVSAEPRADTPAHVAKFLEQVSLSGRVLYLTGSLAQLQPVWRAYRVVPGTSGRAAFDNHASVLLLDRAGAERVLFQSEQLTPEALAHDIGKLSGG